MEPLKNRISKANSLLYPYATPYEGSLGREHPEKEDTHRFPFQRDRGRLIHTRAFRRLQGKTQVFTSGHGDHFRNRMSHTLEVVQISRDIARTLGLNEDLAECIGIAHDLGHTPFGHAGEEAMDACMKKYQKKFEHNEQSLRIVTVLESHTHAHAGLNLSKEILDGLVKHRSPQKQAISGSPSLEAQIVNIADEIAYTAHDIEDGMRDQQFTLDDVGNTALGRSAMEKATPRGTEIRGGIVDLLVTDLYAETESRLKRLQITSLQDVHDAKESIVDFSAEMRKSLDALRAFLWDRLYMSDDVKAQANAGQKVIQDLFAEYMARPPKEALELQKKTNGALEEAVKDYIAGMTDEFARGAHAML